jgi:Protein of unknown function (DUF2795)
MAYGIGEDPAKSVTSHLDGAEYPIWREQLGKQAMDNGAPVDVINLIKSLPRGRYESKAEVQRDLAEAARRFALGNFSPAEDDGAHRDRRNIGRDAIENAPEPHTRHP